MLVQGNSYFKESFSKKTEKLVQAGLLWKKLSKKTKNLFSLDNYRSENYDLWFPTSLFRKKNKKQKNTLFLHLNMNTKFSLVY